MKQKTSPCAVGRLIAKLDRLAGPDVSRLSFIEKILWNFVEGRGQTRRAAREVAAINRHAVKLNAEMKDALSFQRVPRQR
jgi:hypothetical protein